MKTPRLPIALLALALPLGAFAAEPGAPRIVVPGNRPTMPLHGPVATPRPAPRPPPVVILYEHDNFGGRSVSLSESALNLVPQGFNDQASSFKVRYGYKVTFFEDSGGKGEWFTFNCPQPIGMKQGEYCELHSVGNDIATGTLCELRSRGAHGCVPWWNDRITGVRIDGLADEHTPQGRVAHGHDD